ncbi:MAG TPA: hypothetical protein EYP14_04985 [Planctomycetaceae bacterium]|nr:hypothetical protein [Planctomycetaceae bacterium]
MTEPSASIPGAPDLISAYYDGELAPAEREQAERLLGASPDAIAELEAYRRISRLLGELPQESLPEEFASAVLQSAEREMLLRPQHESAAATRQSHWRWRSAARGAVAAAVVAAVAVTFLFVGPRQGDRPQEVAFRERSRAPVAGPTEMGASQGAEALPKAVEVVREPSTPSVVAARAAGALGRGDVPTETRARSVAAGPPSGVADVVCGAASLPQPSAESTETVMEGRPAPSDSVTVAAVPQRKAGVAISPPSSKPEAEPGSHPRWRLSFDRRTLSEAQVGQVIEALATAEEGQVAVVRLTVVDRRRGLESLQLLLAQNQIVPAGPEPPVLHESVAAETTPEELVAVYVQSTTDRLSAALKALQRDGLFRALAVESPIQLAALDQATRLRIEGLVAERSDSGSERQTAAMPRRPSAPVTEGSGEGRTAGVEKRTDRTTAEGVSKSAGLTKGRTSTGAEALGERAEAKLAGGPTDRKGAAKGFGSKPAAPPKSADKPGSLVSRQLALTLRADLVGILEGTSAPTGGESTQPDASSAKRSSPTSPSRKPLVLSATGPRPLQVLFVLVPNGSRSAHPPASRAPGAKGTGTHPSSADPGEGAT